MGQLDIHLALSVAAERTLQARRLAEHRMEMQERAELAPKHREIVMTRIAARTHTTGLAVRLHLIHAPTMR